MKIKDFILEKNNDTYYFYSITTGIISKISKEIYLDLKNYFPNVNHEDTKRLIQYIDSSPAVQKVAKVETENLLNNLVFISSEHCNLKCKYCFAGEGNYHQKKPQNMSFECYKEAVEHVLEKYSGIRSICFFGGEPLINFKEIQKFIEYYRQLIKIRDLTPTSIGIITNGTLVNEKVAKFLEENNIKVTLSIDGSKDVNDFGRVSDVIPSVYDKIFNNFKNFYSSNKELAIEATITDYHIKKYNKSAVKRWIKDLEQLNYEIIAFLPVVTEDKDTKISDIQILKEIYKDIVDYYFDLLITGENVNSIEVGVLGMIKGIIGKKSVGDCGIASSLLVTPSGDLYPCQAFYESRTYQLGNIKNDKITPFYQELTNLDRLNVPKCQGCKARHLCGSWCVGMNNNLNGQLESTIDLSCIAVQTTMERTLKNLFGIIEDQEKYKKFIQNVQHLLKVEEDIKS